MADSLHILDSALAFPFQCDQVMWEIAQENVPAQCYLAENIVISGMGGSALGGRIISSLERQVLKVPIVVSTEYHLPNFVNKKTLVIVSSYSGNTAETLHSIAEARARDAGIFIIASGGRLAEIAAKCSLPCYIFDPRHNPSGQPRMGLGYSIMGIVSVLARCQLIHPIPGMSKIKHFLQTGLEDLKPYEEVAGRLKDRITVIIAAEHLKGAAHAFKNQLNETSKSFSCLFDIPEMNHHLLEGLSRPRSNPGQLHFLFIESDHYHSEVKKRFPITKEIVTNNHVSYSSLPVSSPNRLFDALSLVQSGSLISYYLSQMYDIDPGPIPWVDYFKESLNNINNQAL